MRLAALALLSALACGDTAVVVDVDVRLGIGDLTSLEVVARNDGDTQVATFDLVGQSFPTSFSITAAGRSGEIVVELAARDGSGLIRAVATGTGELSDGSTLDLDLRLDPADFVVNTETDGAQRPVFRAGRYGKQIAETDTGGFAVTFVNDCLNPALCDVFVRRFDADGLPFAGDGSQIERAINSGNYPEVSVPAISTSGTVAMAWEISTAVMFAAINETGGVVASDTAASDPAALDPVDPDIAVLANGNIATTWVQERIDAQNPEGVWQGIYDGQAVTQTLIRDDGTAATPALVELGGNIATTWAETSALMLAFSAPGATPANFFANDFGEPARVQTPNIIAAGGDVIVGYGVSSDGAVELMLSRVNTAGNSGGEAVVTPASSGDTLALAVDASGRVAAVWQGCDELGDDDGCGIFLSLYSEDLTSLGEPIRVNTTTDGDQVTPSVAATSSGFAVVWADLSGSAPDDSPAVRARVIYADTL